MKVPKSQCHGKTMIKGEKGKYICPVCGSPYKEIKPIPKNKGTEFEGIFI